MSKQHLSKQRQLDQLLQAVATSSEELTGFDRRNFLRQGLTFLGGAGLAWSGRGKIKRVDVSFDGGVSWRPTRFTSTVLPGALTRFGVEWDWDGSTALVQSRAVDETGYVQPTYTQLRSARGTASIYHKNAIHTWQVETKGSVRNVQIS